MKASFLLLSLFICVSEAANAQRVIGPEDLINEYARRLKKSPRDKSLLLKLGSLHSEKNQYKLAHKYLSKAYEFSKNDVPVLFELAYVKQRLGKIKEAKTLYNKILKLKPHSENALFNLGVVNLKSDKKVAKNYFKRVLKVDPSHPSANFSMGELSKMLLKLCIKHWENLLRTQ